MLRQHSHVSFTTSAADARAQVAESDVHSRPENRRENTMKKLFAALAVLGVVLGTATLMTPAHAAYYSFEGNQNQGNNQGTS
jgi:hypothetical protein